VGVEAGMLIAHVLLFLQSSVGGIGCKGDEMTEQQQQWDELKENANAKCDLLRQQVWILQQQIDRILHQLAIASQAQQPAPPEKS
jgi:hypothetical protein